MNQDILMIDEVMPLALESGLFVSLCTIQSHDGALDAGGAPIYGDEHWATIFADIPCMAAPTSQTGITATEAKALVEIVATNMSHVLLSGYYPTILPEWRAIIDGTTYDILGAESDSQAQMTRMEVRLARI